ncbi:MAG TPA: hypothetical protein VGE52_19045, partial [Pirellulales bacterium]
MLFAMGERVATFPPCPSEGTLGLERTRPTPFAATPYCSPLASPRSADFWFGVACGTEPSRHGRKLDEHCRGP